MWCRGRINGMDVGGGLGEIPAAERGCDGLRSLGMTDLGRGCEGLVVVDCSLSVLDSCTMVVR